jgi:hypothetical protein
MVMPSLAYAAAMTRAKGVPLSAPSRAEHDRGRHRDVHLRSRSPPSGPPPRRSPPCADERGVIAALLAGKVFPSASAWCASQVLCSPPRASPPSARLSAKLAA